LASNGGTEIRLWDVDTGKSTTLKGLNNSSGSLAFNPVTGALAATDSSALGDAKTTEAAIQFWDPSTGKSGGKLTLPAGAQPANDFYFLAFAPDGKTLTTCSSGLTFDMKGVWTTVHRLQLPGGKEVKTLKLDHTVPLGLTDDATTLATRGDAGDSQKSV